MYYQKLTTTQLSKYKYPNLIAELIESHYSICTVAEHIGMGRRSETDLEVWDKLTGKTEIFASEGMELSKLFGVTIEYLFSHELTTFRGQPKAFWRWLDFNRKIQEDSERYRVAEEVKRRIMDNPLLLKFFRKAVTWSDEELQQIIDWIEEKKTA